MKMSTQNLHRATQRPKPMLNGLWNLTYLTQALEFNGKIKKKC